MAAEVVKEEADKQREMYDDLGADLSQLRMAHPDRRFKWVNRDIRRTSRHKALGYEYATDKEALPLVAQKDEHGHFIFGDTVLMACPMVRYQHRVARNRRKQELWEGAGREQARENINRIARDEGRVSPHKDIVSDESGAH